MKNDKLKLDFINSYISSYETKIKTANSCGLFDEAKLFENFACNVCSLFYGTGFVNLNITQKENFPCADLYSSEKELFIQVSTTKEWNSKILSTLNAIHQSDNETVKNIKNINFFFLNYDEISILDRTGENAVHGLEFVRSRNLITTKTILKKAEDNETFRDALYNLLVKDEKSVDSLSIKFLNSINVSKSVGLANIDDTINGKLTINRDHIVDTIVSSNSKIIGVLGDPGSGKSVITKMVAERFNYPLFIRAEKIAECKSINELFEFDLYYAVHYVSKETICFVVDALEFLVDRQTKIDLLDELMLLINNNDNLKLVFSCRIDDINSFLFLSKKYQIKNFIVKGFNEKEVGDILERFSLNPKILGEDVIELLHNPFYASQIVKLLSEGVSVQPQAIRNLIFENIIIPKKKCEAKGYDYNQVRETVISLTKMRAQQFLLSVNKNVFDSKIIKLLIDERIIVERNEKIRLKYDIFEDIVFERIIDGEFSGCSGNNELFFNSIFAYGRCAYRRYQIWISNKLSNLQTIESFIAPLVFATNNISWKINTIIGIIKSDNCSGFFEKYKERLTSEQETLKLFIKLTNVYLFSISDNPLGNVLPVLLLQPQGIAREKLIKLLFEKELFKNDGCEYLVSKLCSDCIKSKASDDVKTASCKILISYFESYLNTCNERRLFVFNDHCEDILNEIYNGANHCKEWIKDFFIKLKEWLLSNDSRKQFAEEAVKHAIRIRHVNLDVCLWKDLCELFAYFITFNENTPPNSYWHQSEPDKNSLFGLNKMATDFEYSRRDNWLDKPFFETLFRIDLIGGLNWAIGFLNTLFEVCSKNTGIPTISLTYHGVKNDYYCCETFWMCTVNEYSIPIVLSDILFSLKEVMISFAEDPKSTELLFKARDLMIQKSNNIAFLSVVNLVGIELNNILPGFAIPLVDAIELMELDFQRFVSVSGGPYKDFLMRIITMKVSVPDLELKYSKHCGKELCFRDYVLITQLQHPDLQSAIFEKLNQLYEKYKNNKEVVSQIEMMDIRKKHIQETDNGFLVSKKNPESLKNTGIIGTLEKRFHELTSLIEKKTENGQKDFEAEVKEIITLLRDNYDGINITHKTIIEYIVIYINLSNFDSDFFNECIDYWLQGLENQEFYFEPKLYSQLLRCVDNESLSSENKTALRRNLLRIMASDSHNDGVFGSYIAQTKDYLFENVVLREQVFAACLMLAKDSLTEEEQEAVFQLFDNGDISFNYSTFNSNEYSFSKLCKAISCGELINNTNYYVFRKTYEMAVCMLNKKEYEHHQSSLVYPLSDLEDGLSYQWQKGNAENLFNFVLSAVDYVGVNYETIELFQGIFKWMKMNYASAKENSKDRINVENCWELLDSFIQKLDLKSPYIKERFAATAVFAGSRFERDYYNKLKPTYSILEKGFLNNVFGKYGYMTLDICFKTLNDFHINSLMPEIVISFREILVKAQKENSDDVARLLMHKYDFINELIKIGLTDKRYEIRGNSELSNSFETILEILTEHGWEEAAFALDEFRLH